MQICISTYMYDAKRTGLGTKLRLLLARLDGELTDLYKREGHRFRPRFFPVFQLLMETEYASVSMIADHLQASQPAATQTLSEMRRLELVTFEAGTDRRKRIVKLTPQALATAKALQPIWEAAECAVERLNDELSSSLSDTLDEAISALSSKSFSERLTECRSLKGA